MLLPANTSAAAMADSRERKRRSPPITTPLPSRPRRIVSFAIVNGCSSARSTESTAASPTCASPATTIVKVAPLLHWSSKELYEYLQAHGLPNNFDYTDPTKGEDNRECGLHLSH